MERRLILWCSFVVVVLLKDQINDNLNLSAVLEPPEKHFWKRFVNRYLEGVPQLLILNQGEVDVSVYD